MKKVLITGPTGVAGTSLIQELVRHGISVTAVIRPGSRRRGAILDHSLVEVTECGLHELALLPERLADGTGHTGRAGRTFTCRHRT